MQYQNLVIFNKVGVPIAIWNHGNHSLPFPLVGLFSAIHTSSLSQLNTAVHLLEAASTTVCLKMYHDNILIALVTNEKLIEEQVMNELLDAVFASLVMCVGRSILLKETPHPHLSVMIRPLYPLFDLFLPESGAGGRFSLILRLHASEAILQLKNNPNAKNDTLIYNTLGQLNITLNQVPLALFHGHSVYLASESFWDRLNHIEVALIAGLVNSLPQNYQQYDIPLYLPYFRPAPETQPGTIPFRLLALKLYNNLHLVMLCGQEPYLPDFYSLAIEAFTPITPFIAKSIEYYLLSSPSLPSSLLSCFIFEANKFVKYTTSRAYLQELYEFYQKITQNFDSSPSSDQEKLKEAYLLINDAEYLYTCSLEAKRIFAYFKAGLDLSSVMTISKELLDLIHLS